MRRPSLRRLSLGAAAGAVLALVLVLGPLLPVGDGWSSAHDAFTGASVQPSSSDLSAYVTFQGDLAGNHTSPGSAIVTSFGGVFTTVFTWKSPNQATLVNKGTLTVLFLGATVGTSSSSLSGAGANSSGTITLTSDFTQDKYLFEGVYQLQATLFDQGQAIWNTTFYVWVQAPDHLTVINIALILIGILEIYQIAALGSVRVARKQMGLEPPPKQGGT